MVALQKTENSQKNTVQCPCGKMIESTEDYQLLFLKKEMNEIDILCPNDTCYLRELGFITFEKIDTPKKQIKLNQAVFYVPFVTWNATRLTEKKAAEILKKQLIDLVQNHVEWHKLV
ncbi:MAG: hypothetical protein ACFFB5_10480 [Promethearchaeota archaeon]